MSRPKRIEFEGAWYHVFNRGIQRRTVFHSEYHYQLFLDLLLLAVEKYQIEIHSYCLMKNHYHLLVRTPKANLSKSMQYFTSRFAYNLNKNISSDGAVFKGRFKSILVDDETYLLNVCRYIHRNPIEAQYVENVIDYKWSSVHDLLKNNQDPLLFKDKIITYFKKPSEFLDYLKLDIDKETRLHYQRQNIPSIFGSKKFIKRIKDKYFQTSI